MRTPNLSRFAVTLCLLVCLTSALAASGEELQYQEQTGKEIMPFIWKVETTGEEVQITILKNGNSSISTCNKDGSTRKWQLTDIQKGNLEAVRVGNILNVNGKLAGKPYENAVGLGDQPWFQSPYYALAKFAISPYRDISFWTFQEGESVPVLLKARKRGAEGVEVNGKIVQAQKVEVFSDDFFSKLWRGFFWFREDDNRLVMYRSEPGIPGAKETVVTLSTNP